METPEKYPEISILVATYNPNLNWLKEQLLSLKAQTYPNITVYIRDDASPKVEFTDIAQTVQECLQGMQYTIEQNEKNIGSNGTFEKLTQEAEGAFIAYCDQDDIWKPDKLMQLYERLVETGAVLSCCDAAVIDKNGNLVADSLKEQRRRLEYKEGDHLSPYLLIRNFAAGSAMIVEAALAKAAVPFEPLFVYDQWIAFYSSLKGKICVAPGTWLYHREHGENQTSILAGMDSKETYYQKRVLPSCENLENIEKRLTNEEKKESCLEQALDAARARVRYMKHPGWKDARTIIGMVEYSWQMKVLELCFPFLPDFLFRKIIEAGKRGKL